MGRKTTVQIFQVTNINIDRKTIKTTKQQWEKKTAVQVFRVTNINKDRKI